uniref:mobility-associated LCxxNW protein n=1 Tax=Coprococcus catus TaxID=116085 RepID=UPI002FE6E190
MHQKCNFFYVSARLELEECDELCHGNWIEIESLQRQVDFLKKLLEENSIVLPDDYYDL